MYAKAESPIYSSEQLGKVSPNTVYFKMLKYIKIHYDYM